MINTALTYHLHWLLLAAHFVTRARPIDDIDGKSHKTKLKSSRNYSTNHFKSNSCHYLYVCGLGGGHTHTHINTHTYFGGMKVISRSQVCAWFENHGCINI